MLTNMDNSCIKIESFNLFAHDIEVGIYRNSFGCFAVVMREGCNVKGLTCVSRTQASDIYAVCVEKIKSKYVDLN